MTRSAAITLKIPDNEAYTAFAALRRLGVEVERVERAEIWIVQDEGDASDFARRMERNETLFNPNKHVLRVLDEPEPGAGEVWVEAQRAAEISENDLASIGGRGVEGVTRGRRCVGWRLFADGQQPANSQTLHAAAEKLLCNPAIEKATIV